MPDEAAHFAPLPPGPSNDADEKLEQEQEQKQEQEEFASSSSLPSGILEGTLLYRQGRSAKSVLKQSIRVHTVFDMSARVGIDFGSLKCYRFVGLGKKEASLAYSSTKLTRGDPTEARNSADAGSSISDMGGGDDPAADFRKKQLCILDIAAELPWTVRDVENDPTAFIVEISTSGFQLDGGGDGDDNQGTESGRSRNQSSDDDFDVDEEFDGDDEDGVFVFWGDEADDDAESTQDESERREQEEPNQVLLDLATAASKSKPFVRYAFRCPSKRNEKALWLAAFGKVGRLSTESNRKKSFFGTASAALSVPTMQRNSRIRTSAAADHARQSLAMERDTDVDTGRDAGVKEYRVRPSYAYPHRWMTKRELTEECQIASAMVHDLRLPPAVAASREVGNLTVEVLQCIGLPRHKGKTAGTATDPNAVVYLVCGAFAFCTDRIISCQNPMWLSGMKRSCIFPIYHGYAKLFGGIFHDDGSKSTSKDIFIGRVAVEIARLRPGCTYDVTLPLRLSTNVYSRRKRGAIRLRLTLNYLDEKQVVLSYLPNRRNKVAGKVGTTVACADAKAFRNIALTVHGTHLPGKFSTESFMATIREFKFVQKSIKRLIEKFVHDLVVWRHPAVSAFAFLGWMHSVRAGSATLVPVYMLGMGVLLLMANYARCIVIVSGVETFQPPTFEEILFALIKGGAEGDDTKTYIKPIEVKKNTSCVGGLGDGDSSLTQRGSLRSAQSRTFLAETHKPLGQALFRTLGFLGTNDEYYVGGVDMYAQKEFPFSSLAGYPRFYVDEANSAPALQGRDDEFDEDDMDDTDDMIGPRSQSSGHLNEGDPEAYKARLHFKKPLPEQNIDKKNPKSDKTIAEELQEVEEKVQTFTLQLFDNHTYMITDTTMPPWGRRQQRSDKDGEEYDVKRDLDKLLGLGQFSQWNPLVAKFTAQFEPIVRICEVVLSMYRSIYNIFTWRDPFMSFWVSIGCVSTIALLLLFPWRAVFFIVGLLALGPQNWIMRLFREFVWSDNNQLRPGRFMRAFRELLKPDEGDESREQAVQSRWKEASTAPQPIFHSQEPANRSTVERKETFGAQHVLIPYSPLFCHRFYDWPPDPQYARIAGDMPLDSLCLCSSAPSEIVAVRTLPPPTQEINRAHSIKRDISEATQTPATPPPAATSTSSRSLASASSQMDSTKTPVLQSQTIEKVVVEHNAFPGKMRSRTLDNLNESIAKEGQERKDSAKKLMLPHRKSGVSFEDEATVASSVSRKDGRHNSSSGGAKKLSARALNMSRRISSMSVKLPSASARSKCEESVSGTVTERGESSAPLYDDNVKDKSADVADVTPNEAADRPTKRLIVRENTPPTRGNDGVVGGFCQDGDVVTSGLNEGAVDLIAAVQTQTQTDTATNTGVPTKSPYFREAERQTPIDEDESFFPEDGEEEEEEEDHSKTSNDDGAPNTCSTATSKAYDFKDSASDALSLPSDPKSYDSVSVEDSKEKKEDEREVSDAVLKNGNDEDYFEDDDRSGHIVEAIATTENDGLEIVQEAISTRSTDSSELEMVQPAASSSSPRLEPTALLKQLMAVKLELATARTENDHYRRILQETEEERDMYMHRCIHYEQIQQKQTFKLNMSNVASMSPFTKKKPQT